MATLCGLTFQGSYIFSNVARVTFWRGCCMPLTMSDVMPKKGSLTERNVSAARGVLGGQRRGIGGYLAFAGPAVIVSIAYMDPGNFATNIQAGAKYGYGLLWVVLLANLIAMLLQARTPVHDDNERRKVLRFSNQEVIIALVIAGLVNMAMVMMASGAFHAGHSDVAEIETAYHTLTPLLGIGAAGIFLLSLIVSGVSSSVVGTMAGQMIMQGFVGFRIPIWLRRLITMIPAFVVVALGVNATRALVVSQVVLSIALPLPMIALLKFTGRADIMGKFVNGRMTRVATVVATVLVLGLNAFLIVQTFGVPIPGLR